MNKGRLLVVEDKETLMKQLGRKRLTLQLQTAIDAIPATLDKYALQLADDGATLIFEYDTQAERTGITRLLTDLAAAGLSVRDLDTKQSSLEQIFLSLVEDAA